MADQAILIGLNLLIWSYFIIRFIKAVRRRKLDQPEALFAWLTHLLFYIVALLTVAAVENAIDRFAGGLPITLYLRSNLILLTAQLLARALRGANVHLHPFSRQLFKANPLVIAGLLVFAAIAQLASLDVNLQTIIVKTVRDAVIILWLLFVFVPLEIEAWRQERVRLMRLRDLIVLIFYGIYLLYCSGTLAQSLLVVLRPEQPNQIHLPLEVVAYLCLLLFFLMLLPFRGVRLLLYPQRLWLYRRLRRLQATVKEQAEIDFEFEKLDLNILRPNELETAIYQSLVDILDHYPCMRSTDEAQQLAERIDTVVQQTLPYADLVESLAQVETMIDPEPDHSNRLAFYVGRIFHPYIICVPTLIAVLSDLPPNQILVWTSLVLAVILLPTLLFGIYLQRRGRLFHQRPTRTPLYLSGWLSVLVCLVMLILLDAPQVLIACLTTLAVWLPVQFEINAYITKLSAHAAVAAGCYTGLLLLGKLTNPLVQWGLLVFVAVTVWARVTTRNHSVAQVILGLLVGTLPVLIVFPLVLS